MSLEPYSFCFLRYVHEPLSGEFANVGVLLWAPTSRFLGFRGSHKFRRLSQFFHGFHVQDYRALVGRLETQFDKLAAQLAGAEVELPFSPEPNSARELAMLVVPHDDAALVWSLSGGGLTADPADELRRLFEEAVARHYDVVDEARRDDATVFRDIYSRAFEAPAVKALVSEHEIQAPLASHVFPQAWKNGVWQVYQPLSFDLKRPENIRHKAHQWESSRVVYLSPPEKPKIHLLLGAPGEDRRRDYGMAKDLLHSSGAVTLIEEDEAEDFARDLQHRIAAAG